MIKLRKFNSLRPYTNHELFLRQLVKELLPTWNRDRADSTVLSFMTVDLLWNSTDLVEGEQKKLDFASRVYERMCAEFKFHKLTSDQSFSCGLQRTQHVSNYLLVGRVFE